MKFGIIFANVGPFVTPEGAAAMGKAAEDAGFESLWTVEHVLVPSGYQSAYPYSPTGKMPGPDDSPIPDPLIWLTWVAAHTERIRLATGILILPQRNPGVLAKECATLDSLSGGRLSLGIGVGWLKEEFEALGIPWDDRATRTDEYIEALRALWTQPQASYTGKYAAFSDVNMRPQPVQAGGVPIHVGGHTKAAARRAGRLGDGFFPGTAGADKLEPLLAEMKAAAAEAGRDGDAIEVTSGGAMDPDGIKAMADMGITRVVVPPLAFDLEGLPRALGQFGENVISKLG